MTTPALIINDPWLRPYEEAIVGRLERARKKEAELLSGGSNSLSDFANGHAFFGLHKTKNSWIFREWAPNATHMCLVGTFSGWEEKVAYVFENKKTYWELELPLKDIKHGDLYKIVIYWKNGKGERIPAWATRVVQDENTKIFSAQVWHEEKAFSWKHADFKRPDVAPIIYEAHVGMATEEYKIGSYKDFTINILPKVKKGGYNTLQLMAIQEHPYYGSFGYHVSSFFAPSSRFGTPTELKELIDTAHGMGIAVIMDIVHSHAVKNEIEGLGKYDGTDYQFFHSGPKGNHSAWDSKCFDYGKNEVLHFLLSNCKYWIDEFKFDGFRFDGVTSMLYLDHGLGRDFNNYSAYYDGGEDDDAISYLVLVNKLIHEIKPTALTIAEDMSGMPGLAAPIEYGGYGFNYRLSMGVPDFWIRTLKEKKDEDWHVGAIYHELTQARRDEKVISYAESHDQALVGDKTIAFWLMDKEMYFNMHVGHQNIIIDRGIALHKMIRLITIATAKDGYLNFMGNEFGHPEWIDFPREGNNWSYHHARRLWSLASNEELRYKFLDRFDEAMINLCNSSSYFFGDYPKFVCEHITNQILAFERGGLLFVFNFSPNQSYPDYGIEMKKGNYKIVLNLDSSMFGGINRVDDTLIYSTISKGSELFAAQELKIYLPCQTALVFQRIKEQPI